jgi:hypothetical protein
MKLNVYWSETKESEEKMINILKLLLIGISSLFVLAGCNKTFVYPAESDFRLMSDVSNHNPKPGEEFEVNADLRNSVTQLSQVEIDRYALM